MSRRLHDWMIVPGVKGQVVAVCTKRGTMRVFAADDVVSVVRTAAGRVSGTWEVTLRDGSWLYADRALAEALVRDVIGRRVGLGTDGVHRLTEFVLRNEQSEQEVKMSAYRDPFEAQHARNAQTLQDASERYATPDEPDRPRLTEDEVRQMARLLVDYVADDLWDDHGFPAGYTEPETADAIVEVLQEALEVVRPYVKRKED